MAVRFKGYDIPAEAGRAARELAKDKTVQDELRAAKALDTAKSAIASAAAGSQKRGQAMLERLIKDSPGTEASQEAESILHRIEAK